MRAQSEAATPVNFRRALAALFAFAGLAGGLAHAAGGSPDATGAPSGAKWVSSARSQARLIDGGLIDGARFAGVQISLAGAAVTYWRDPGEAGAPPTFDFAGSQNLLDARILYPQPARIDEGGVEAFGYRREVVFPIAVTARDKKLPIVLDLALDYAVCEAICLPVRARLRLDLPPEPQADAPTRLLLAQALKTIPRALDSTQAKALAQITPFAGENGKPQWLLRLLQDRAETIFVEAPPGFYVESRPAGESNVFLLTLLDHPTGRPLPEAPVRVTVAGPEPAEFELALPQGRK